MRKRTEISAVTYSIILAIAGIEHGTGEILQGNISPPSMMFQSWPDSDLYEIVRGEPAMTLIPNLFITGIMAIVISCLLIIWAVKFIHTDHGGTGILLLSFLMLFFGGGVAGPFLIGITISLASTRINSEFTWWKNHISLDGRNRFSHWWKYIYTCSVVFWFSLWPGLIIVGLFIKLQDPLIVIILSLFSFITMILSIFAAFAADSLLNESKST